MTLRSIIKHHAKWQFGLFKLFLWQILFSEKNKTAARGNTKNSRHKHVRMNFFLFWIISLTISVITQIFWLDDKSELCLNCTILSLEKLGLTNNLLDTEEALLIDDGLAVHKQHQTRQRVDADATSEHRLVLRVSCRYPHLSHSRTLLNKLGEVEKCTHTLRVPCKRIVRYLNRKNLYVKLTWIKLY